MKIVKTKEVVFVGQRINAFKGFVVSPLFVTVLSLLVLSVILYILYSAGVLQEIAKDISSIMTP